MKLEKCYILPPRTFGPQPDYYPDAVKMPSLLYCWRLYPCSCGAITGWRFLVENTPHLVCSTECLEALIQQETTRAADSARES